MSIDRVMAEQRDKFDACLDASLKRIRRIEPPARYPEYNTLADPYRLIGALPPLAGLAPSFPWLVPFMGEL